MSKTDVVKVSELQAGDILLLEAKDDWISKIIAKLTKSEVSHTALSCGKNGNVGDVIEETMPYAIASSVMDRTARKTYVMRLQSNVEDMQPVMEIAQKYVEEELPYAIAALPFIGIYFIVKDVTNSKPLQGLILKLLEIGLGVLIELEDKFLYDGKEVMMCSQFAYHCYRKAGQAYEIHLKPRTTTGYLGKVMEQIKKDPMHYEQLLNNEVLRDHGQARLKQEQLQQEQIDSLLEQLCHSLDQNQLRESNAGVESGNLECLGEELEDEFVLTICRFCRQFCQTFLTKEELGDGEHDITFYLEKLQEMKEYFISPEDLLSNTTNLVCMGTVDYQN